MRKGNGRGEEQREKSNMGEKGDEERERKRGKG